MKKVKTLYWIFTTLFIAFMLITSLSQIISASKPGCESNTETIIFDSTGIASQDVAAAAIVYGRALQKGIGKRTMLA